MPSRRVFVDAIAGVTLSAVAPRGAAEQQKRASDSRRRIIVLDVDETLLDIRALEPQFERVFSSGHVLRAAEPYRYVARELGVSTSASRMTAAHAWDIVAAHRAGCAATSRSFEHMRGS